MCGLAGEFIFRNFGSAGSRACENVVAAMARRLVHRGPDESGSFVSPNGRLAVGFHRLAVIDPARSHQPMSLPDGSATVVFNGEIYNYHQLRRELAAKGANFSSAGDTEVLPHLYRQYGIEMLNHLDGMFAIALYDAKADKLILARDRLGQKPLWYTTLDDRIVFASQLRALLAHPKVKGTTSNAAITSYLTMGYVAAPDSIFEGIHKLPPGCSMTISETPAKPERYWQPKLIEITGSRSEIIERVRSSVTAAVMERMSADVPMGVLLSGGVDSSIVTALVAKSAGKVGGVRTFTAGFEDAGYDERAGARLVAEHCGTEHTEMLIDPHGYEPAELVDNIVAMYDEPFADSSALATHMICTAARRHVTVALAGDGGDEVFGGYDRYRAMHLAERMGAGKYLAICLASTLLKPWATLGGKNERKPLRRFLRLAEALPYPFATQYFMYRRLFSPNDLARLFTPEFIDGVDIEAPAKNFCELYEDESLEFFIRELAGNDNDTDYAIDEVTRAQYHDLMTYLPDDLLVKSDIASMAASLELRAPMLDHNLVCLGLSLPVDLKIARGRGKVALREAFADMLPKQILSGSFNKRKRGFGIPLGRWLRNELRDVLTETLLDKTFLNAGIFQPQAIEGLVNDHLLGRDDHTHRLWALLVLARWRTITTAEPRRH